MLGATSPCCPDRATSHATALLRHIIHGNPQPSTVCHHRARSRLIGAGCVHPAPQRRGVGCTCGVHRPRAPPATKSILGPRRTCLYVVWPTRSRHITAVHSRVGGGRRFESVSKDCAVLSGAGSCTQGTTVVRNPWSIPSSSGAQRWVRRLSRKSAQRGGRESCEGARAGKACRRL